ncbi:uncharacterized protein LOC125679812 isoform X3 [Ostrea edulis]|uniref:uncharacterized protein LOC125679812 isoform X3 n=1 Tax=Ostrea edulis TaxID=37623 RepID=UPI002094BCAC|nr:uncharacterized protein LOC125679812 isoform X3 [Ostrea edulis]
MRIWCIKIEAPTVSPRNNVCMLADGTSACCTGYYEENDVCHECIGSFGYNCSNPCPQDWYGPKCSIQCQCSSIKCDAIYGCAEATTESEKRTVPLDNIPKYPVSDVPSSGGNKLLNFTQITGSSSLWLLFWCFWSSYVVLLLSEVEIRGKTTNA